MEKTQEVPQGLGMALAQNLEAFQRFGAMSSAQQSEIIEHAKNVQSKAEMEALVSGLINRPFF